MSLADQADADSLALALVESARSGRLDPTGFDIACRVALVDEDPSTAGSRHGLDHRQTRATLRSALDALAGDHRRTTFPEPRSRSINPPTDQEVQPMIPPPQPFGAPRDPDSGLPVVPLLLTVNQAAELLGMGRSTIYELIDSGELKSVKRGASRRVPLKAVHDYIEHLLSQQNDDSNRTPTAEFVSPDRPHLRTIHESYRRTARRTVDFDPDLRPIQPDSSEPPLPETATMQLADAVRRCQLDPLDAAIAYQVAVAGLPLVRVTERFGLTRNAAQRSLRAARAAMERRGIHSPTYPRPKGDRPRAG